MEKKLNILNDIFEADLKKADLAKGVEEILEWDSFHIMNFLIEVEERYFIKITIEQISEAKYIQDLLELMKSERGE